MHCVWGALWLIHGQPDRFSHSMETVSGKLNDEVIKGLVFGVKFPLESECYHLMFGVFLQFLEMCFTPR